MRAGDLAGAQGCYAAYESSSAGSGIVDGGSLVGNESAKVLSSILSRRSCLSSFGTGRSSGSRRLPLCSGSAGVTCGFPCSLGTTHLTRNQRALIGCHNVSGAAGLVESPATVMSELFTHMKARLNLFSYP